MRSPLLVSALVLGLLLGVMGATAPARATMVATLSDQQLVDESAHVVEATVESISSTWNAQHNQIYTFVDLSVNGVIKGDSPGNNLRLRLLGGTIDGITMTVVDGPSFETGEKTLLFLGANLQSMFPVTGLDQGKFTIVTDRATGLESVRGRAISKSAFLQTIRSYTR